jgi:small conductance mechanosensitive channel
MENSESGTSLAASSNEAFQHAFTRISEVAAAYSLSVLGAIILLIAGYIAAGIFERWARRAFGKISGFDATLAVFLSKIVRYIVLILVGVTVLAQFGVQTASIIAALGAAGLAIGLALQGTLQNVAAGIMLLVLRPFRAGEYIAAGGVDGTIVEIGLFATELKTLDGLFVLTPNSQLWSSSVVNYSRHDTRRYDLAIGIGYDDDIALAEKLMIDMAGADDRVLDAPPPITFVAELGDNAVTVTLRYWTKTSDWFQTTRDFTRQAKLVFDENGISIPFPQRDFRLIHTDDDKALE